MMGNVNHDMHHVDLWMNSKKWPGSIPIDWVEVKDIHNNHFIHVENPLNENKPFCQSRDCQEVFPKVGEKILLFFKEFKHKSSFYDDFLWFEQ
jgi:hypothetical protein